MDFNIRHDEIIVTFLIKETLKTQCLEGKTKQIIGVKSKAYPESKSTMNMQSQ